MGKRVFNTARDLSLAIIRNNKERIRSVDEAMMERDELIDSVGSAVLNGLPRNGNISNPTQRKAIRLKELNDYIDTNQNIIDKIQQAYDEFGKGQGYDAFTRDEIRKKIMINIEQPKEYPYMRLNYPYSRNVFHMHRRMFVDRVAELLNYKNPLDTNDYTI